MIARGRNRFATLRQNDLIATRFTIALNLGNQPPSCQPQLTRTAAILLSVTVLLFSPRPHRRGWWRICPAPIGFVVQHEIRCLNAPLVFLERDEKRVQSTRGKKRSFDGPRRFAREH